MELEANEVDNWLKVFDLRDRIMMASSLPFLPSPQKQNSYGTGVPVFNRKGASKNIFNCAEAAVMDLLAWVGVYSRKFVFCVGSKGNYVDT